MSCTHHRIIYLTIYVGSLMGCMVGPNFHSPPLPSVATYTAHPLPRQTVATRQMRNGGKSQIFRFGMDLPAEWWYLFHSRDLNALINQGLTNNPNLEAAMANLRIAQENLNATIGNTLFPTLDASLMGEREKFSSVTTGLPGTHLFNLFNASVNISYSLDLFGGARRHVEALIAQVDYQQFQLIAAYTTLTSNIVTTSITAAALQAQILATLDLIRLEQDQLAILKKQFLLGGIAKEAVLTQQTLLEQTRATLPPLEKHLAQTHHVLAILIGSFPNRSMPIIKLNDLTLPKQLPLSVPSHLVRQRADVRAAEALLHAASAQIGVATANLFPQINLTGSDGWQALTIAKLFTPSSTIWNIGGQLTQPIFHGGALLAQRRQAMAAYDQAFALYKQTILQAFQNVADALRAIETDAHTLHAQKKAESAAQQNLRLTQQQLKLGGVSYLTLLIAQQQYQSARLLRIQAQADRYNDTVALFQALGGGWWNKNWCNQVLYP